MALTTLSFCRPSLPAEGFVAYVVSLFLVSLYLTVLCWDPVLSKGPSMGREKGLFS